MVSMRYQQHLHVISHSLYTIELEQVNLQDASKTSTAVIISYDYSMWRIKFNVPQKPCLRHSMSQLDTAFNMNQSQKRCNTCKRKWRQKMKKNTGGKYGTQETAVGIKTASQASVPFFLVVQARTGWKINGYLSWRHLPLHLSKIERILRSRMYFNVVASAKFCCIGFVPFCHVPSFGRDRALACLRSTMTRSYEYASP